MCPSSDWTFVHYFEKDKNKTYLVDKIEYQRRNVEFISHYEHNSDVHDESY